MTSQNEMLASTFGIACGNAIVNKTREEAKANQNAIAACALGFTQYTFNAKVTNKAGEVTDDIRFKLEDILTPLKNEAGNNYSQGNEARYQHVIERMFGIVRSKVLDSVYNNARTQLTEAVKIALAIQKAGYVFGKPNSEGVVQYGWNEKANKLIVPYEFVNPAPKADADENKKTTHKALVGSPVILDGKNKQNYKAVRSIAIPAKAKGTEKKTENEFTAKTLSAAIDMVKENVTLIMNPKKKGKFEPIALSDDLKEELYQMVMACNVMFAEDPAALKEVPKGPRKSGDIQADLAKSLENKVA